MIRTVAIPIEHSRMLRHDLDALLATRAAVQHALSDLERVSKKPWRVVRVGEPLRNSDDFDYTVCATLERIDE